MYRSPCLVAVVAAWMLVSCSQVEALDQRPQIVTLTLALADDDPATVYVPSGGMATYRSNRYDYMVGIIPRVTDAETGRVSIDVVEISGTRNARKAERVVDTIEGTIGFPDVTAAHRGLPLALEVVRLAGSRDDHFAKGCVVSCGNVEIGAFAVITSCGSCSALP